MKKIAYLILGLLAIVGVSSIFPEIKISTIGYFLEDGDFASKSGVMFALTGMVLPSHTKLRYKASELKKIDVDKGIYKDSRKLEQGIEDFLLKLEVKNGYTVDASSALSKIGALERQLMANGLNPFSQATLIEDFFKTDNSKVLFPAWITKQIYMGMQAGKLELNVEDLKASSQKIPSTSIDQIGLNFDEEDVELAKTAEGSLFPVATMRTKELPSKMGKIGRKFLISYEASRRVNIDIASIFFQRIGNRIAKQMAQKGLQVMIEGDGNPGTASQIIKTEGTTYTDADIINLLIGDFEDGVEPSHFVLNKKMLARILTDKTNFEKFQSVNISEKLITSGVILPYLGCTWKTHKAMPDNQILAYDKGSCLAYYEEQNSSIVEYDKIIDTQFEKSVISLYYGFTKLIGGSSIVKELKTI
ncbi:phage capsid protein [Leptospira interrogans]|uniref:Phage capsid protein n=1 Tax=Leptospira interrogans TaxID=173 RepID=A0AAV9FTX7_LEPIR|nr:hypothetical protein [Leptospira interrogans]KAK2620463.1 phage capsid protein [Leptospira interrogans]